MGEQTADGRISYPIGTDPLGYITYSADGYVFVAIMRPNRRKFSAGDLLRGTPEEKAHAAAGVQETARLVWERA